MKLQQKIEINNMYINGSKPSVIARTLNIPPSTVRSYLHRHSDMFNTVLCKQCGKAMSQHTKGRSKKFCSDSCRNTWWNNNLSKVNKKAYYSLTCQHCGKEFESYGNKDRKYCSRECYIASRYKQ